MRRFNLISRHYYSVKRIDRAYYEASTRYRYVEPTRLVTHNYNYKL